MDFQKALEKMDKDLKRLVPDLMSYIKAYDNRYTEVAIETYIQGLIHVIAKIILHSYPNEYERQVRKIKFILDKVVEMHIDEESNVLGTVYIEMEEDFKQVEPDT